MQSAPPLAPWILVAASAAAWLAVISFGVHPLAGLSTAAAHAAAQSWVLVRRGHIALSADPVALPAALAALVAAVLTLRHLGVEPLSDRSLLALLLPLGPAWLAGHAAAALAAVGCDRWDRRR